jgi:cytochrome b
MNATSASPAERITRVLIWDAPVRVFHWLMVLCFAGAYITAESEPWRLVHTTLGYTMVGLVAFRLMWGVTGTRYARFAEFVRRPKVIVQYLSTMVRGQPVHHTGHNPVGAVSILGLLGLTLAIGASGWAAYNQITGEWVAEVHEVVANGMLLLAGMHVAGVAVASFMHKENLARAMVTGRKRGTEAEGIRSAWRLLAVVMLVAVLGFWWLQWESAPSGGVVQAGTPAAVKVDSHDD